MLVAVALSGCSQANSVPTSSAAVAALEYLGKQDGVTAHVVEGNCVFVVFSQPPPQDWKQVLEDAALAGNQATDDEFIASGISGASGNWRAYADSNTIGVAVALDSQLVQ